MVKKWYHTPIWYSLCFGGQLWRGKCPGLLQTIFLKIKAVPVPATFPVPLVQKKINQEGEPSDKAATDKRVAVFIKELLWFAEAFSKMQIMMDLKLPYA